MRLKRADIKEVVVSGTWMSGSDCTWRDPYLVVDLTLHGGGAALIPDPSARVASSNAPQVWA